MKKCVEVAIWLEVLITSPDGARPSSVSILYTRSTIFMCDGIFIGVVGRRSGDSPFWGCEIVRVSHPTRSAVNGHIRLFNAEDKPSKLCEKHHHHLLAEKQQLKREEQYKFAWEYKRKQQLEWKASAEKAIAKYRRQGWESCGSCRTLTLVPTRYDNLRYSRISSLTQHDKSHTDLKFGLVPMQF